MAWDLWSSSFDQVSSDDNYSELYEWQYDYFRCGRDEIEEDALNVESCVQVLKFLITKADTEIEKLEKVLLSLQNELAWTEDENWPEICCSALTERIDRLDAAITTLKSDHVDDTEMQLLLQGKPAETLHEIVKAVLHKDHGQDTHGQLRGGNIPNPIVNVTAHAPDNDSKNINSNGIIREGGKEDFGNSENSKSSELLLELHDKRSDYPEKTEESLALSLVRSPDLGVVSCVPYHSDRMILSDTLDDKVTGDEDVRQSDLVPIDTCQILNQFLSKGKGNIPNEAEQENTTLDENVCSDDCRNAIIKGIQLNTTESGQILNPLLSKENGNIPSETKEENKTVKENVCSDDHRLAIIKGGQLIVTDTGQILNQFSSKGNGNIPSEAKEENTTLKENVCSDDERLAIIKESLLIAKDRCQILNPFSFKGNGNIPSEAKEENTILKEKVCSDDYRLGNRKRMKMYSRSRFGTAQQEESENSDLAKKLCDFVPKTAGRACRKESKVVADEDLESLNVPLQIVYPEKLRLADTESSAFKNNGNNSPQVVTFEKATLNAENSALISLPGMQTKNALCTRLQLIDEEKPQAQDIKSKIAANFSKSNKHFPSKLNAHGKKKPKFEAYSAREPLYSPAEVIPSTSENVSTKRQRKLKTDTAGTILNELMNSKTTKTSVQPVQHVGNDIVLYDSDYASTKRQRKPKTCTAGTVLNEPINWKITKRDVQPGQHETDDNAIVLYDSEFSDFQNSIASEVQNSIVNYLDITNSDRSLALVDSHNESSAFLTITSTEALMKLTLTDLKAQAKQYKIEKYYKLRKADLVKQLVMHRSRN